MPTPEGRVKDAVKKRLAHYNVHPFEAVAAGLHPGAEGTYYMPVAGPFSVHGVHDFIVCWRGVFCTIETKAPNEPQDETVHQGRFRTAVTLTGGISLTGVRDAAAVDHLATLIERKHHAEVHPA